MHRSRTAFALGLTVPLLLVSACSGDPEPKVAPSTSPSTSVSSSPSPSGPVEPVMPEAAKAHTAAGAEAFVTFYWEMVDYAQLSRDVRPLQLLGEQGCAACDKGVEGLRRTLSSGGEYKGGTTSADHFESHEIRSGSHRAFSVSADLTNTREVIDYPGNRASDVYPASTIRLRFIVDVTSTGLTMAYFDRVQA